MSFTTYWGRKLLKNKQLIEADTITISIPSFKKELEKAYQAGQADPLPRESMSSPLDDFLKGFGKK